MKKQYDGYAVVPFAPVRRMIVDVLEMGHRKHMIHGLVEVDVTRARRYIRDYEATTGKDLSFTAFIVACLGKAVERNKYMHAYRSGRNHLVLFDEVDVNTQIEIEMDGRRSRFPTPSEPRTRGTYSTFTGDPEGAGRGREKRKRPSEPGGESCS